MRKLSIVILSILFIPSSAAMAEGIVFEEAVNYSTGGVNVAVLPGDFDGDGHIDLAACRDELAILPGNGDGTFQEAVIRTAFLRPPICFGVADLDNDGDPDVMGGTPVFRGTRVPVQTLIDYLEGGESIDDFLQGFPTVTRDQVIDLLELAKEKVLVAA